MEGPIQIKNLSVLSHILLNKQECFIYEKFRRTALKQT